MTMNKTKVETSCANKLKNMGKGHCYKFHNVENQKEHRKIWRRSQHQKALLKGSERRKRKRSEHRKSNNHNVEKS